MIESSYSLYKLIILYMLKKVNFPLTNSQISDLVLGEDYTTYFHLQQVLSEMVSSDLIATETKNHTTYYRMTDQGKQTIEYFESEISPEIRREISNYLILHSYEMRQESTTTADYFRSANGDYTVSCAAKEGNRTLIDLKFTVPTEHAAETLADNWKKKAPDVYAKVMELLM